MLNYEKLHFRPALEENTRMIVAKCESIFKDIEKYTSGPDNTTAMKLAWYFKRERVKPLRASLESLKSTLHILLQVVQLAKTTQEFTKGPTKTVGHWTIKKERRSLVSHVMDKRAQVFRLRTLEEETSQETIELDVDNLAFVCDGSSPLPNIFIESLHQAKNPHLFVPPYVWLSQHHPEMEGQGDRDPQNASTGNTFNHTVHKQEKLVLIATLT